MRGVACEWAPLQTTEYASDVGLPDPTRLFSICLVDVVRRCPERPVKPPRTNRMPTADGAGRK